MKKIYSFILVFICLLLVSSVLADKPIYTPTPVFIPPTYTPAPSSANKQIEIDDILLKGTIESAKGQLFPNNKGKVTYNKKEQSVYVYFETPSSYKVDFGNFYSRWRDNQWCILQEFKRSEIPVLKITVETNYHDNSGNLKATHLAKHVDSYAKKPNDTQWLNTGTLMTKGNDSDEWSVLPK